MGIYETSSFESMLIPDVFASMKASTSWHDRVNLQDGPGLYPYLSQVRGNNGVATLVGAQQRPPEPGNCITVTLKTQSTFYQPRSFYTAQNFLIFRHPRLNRLNGLVLVSAMRHAMTKFSWGYGVSMQRLSRTRIMVPTRPGEDGCPVVDWTKLDTLGHELLATATGNARNALRADEASGSRTLPDLIFEPMMIPDVVDSMKASSAWYDRSRMDTRGKAVFPYVSRSKLDNGVDGFFPRQAKEPECGNAVTIGLDTQTIGYQPVPFYTSQNIQILRHDKMNEDSGLVLAALIRQQMGKFSWGGNGATLGRLRKTRIMAPVTTDERNRTVVDWDGMSAYGRILRGRVEKSFDQEI